MQAQLGEGSIPHLTALLEALIKENNEQTNQGNDSQNDKGCGKRIHLMTSLPSRKWPTKAKINPTTMPVRSPRKLKLSAVANGPITRRVNATFAMSQKNFAKLSFCFSVRMIFTSGFYGPMSNRSSTDPYQLETKEDPTAFAPVVADLNKRATHLFYVTGRLSRGPGEATTTSPLGHRDLSTPMIYIHVLNRGGKGVRSPVDELAITVPPGRP